MEQCPPPPQPKTQLCMHGKSLESDVACKPLTFCNLLVRHPLRTLRRAVVKGLARVEYARHNVLQTTSTNGLEYPELIQYVAITTKHQDLSITRQGTRQGKDKLQHDCLGDVQCRGLRLHAKNVLHAELHCAFQVCVTLRKNTLRNIGLTCHA